MTTVYRYLGYGTTDSNGVLTIAVTGKIGTHTLKFTNPVTGDEVTTTVKIEGNDTDLLPVRSNKPLPKELLFDCMEVIKKTSVKLPVAQYDVVVPNICDSGVDIVATKAL